MNKALLSVSLASTLFLSAAGAAAQTADSADITALSLKELLDVEVTSTASKFPQPVTRAPASITVVTADEIRRFGYRTLADALRSVRGLYVSDDRNYSYAGVRGLSRPGDYNTRLLLLIDGHRLNDPIYDMAPIGNDLPIDMESIDRIEVVRGPGSALYGTSAFLAVVNVITRTGRQEQGVRVTTEGGDAGTVRGRASFGGVLGNGADITAGVSVQRASGDQALFFPEIDAANPGGGIARNSDGDRAARVFTTISFGQWSIHAAQGERDKQVPTAPFGTLFDDGRMETRDSRGYLDLTHTGALGSWSTQTRASYDRYHYLGIYPYAADDGGTESDRASSDWLRGEFTANRRMGARHLFTAGTDLRYAVREKQYVVVGAATAVYDDRHSAAWGIFAQDEFSLTSKLVAIGGVRVDRSGMFDSQATPRAGLVFNPSTRSALKIMHGRAFRAPNAFEAYFYQVPGANTELQPETIATTEAVWEQDRARRVRSTISVFHSNIENLISQTLEDDRTFPFDNLQGAKSTGVEGEVEARFGRDALARGSYAWTMADDDRTQMRLSNSPMHLVKYDVIVPVLGSRLFAATSGAFMSTRQSIRGASVDSAYLQNLTLTADHVLERANLTFGVYNLFDQHYSDPGAEEHVQDLIPQTGRSLRAALTVRF